MESEIINTGFAVAGGLISWLWGDMDGFMKVLLAFVIIDYLTGITGAYITHTLDSDIGYHGIARKVVIFMLVSIANIIDQELLHANFLRDAIVFFYLGNEGLSILENCVKIGLPFPESLKKRLLSWANEEEEAVQVLSGHDGSSGHDGVTPPQ